LLHFNIENTPFTACQMHYRQSCSSKKREYRIVL